MSRALLTTSTAFTAGAVGAVVNSAAVLAAARYGILRAVGVMLMPHLSLSWIYPRIVWGGLWGLLLAIPFGPRTILGRGLLWSLPPTLFQLLWVFPVKTRLGVLGIGAGVLTPLVVVVVNGIWGITAAVWLRIARN